MFDGSGSPAREYFTDSAGTASPPVLFIGVNNMVLDFCSQIKDSITPTTRETAKDGNFDILNFLWFAGPGGVYDNSTGKSKSYMSYNM